MKVVFDIECNRLHDPDKIWVIVLKDIDNHAYYVFRNLTDDADQREKFHAIASRVRLWIGHNVLGYDLPILADRLGLHIPVDMVCDTLIASRLLDYSIEGGHSIEAYGERYGIEKITHTDFTCWSRDLETYCIRDSDICSRLYSALAHKLHSSSLLLEQRFQVLVNSLSKNGFAFNRGKAEKLLEKVKGELNELDQEIVRAFPPRLYPIREITPRLTRHGTLNKSDFRWELSGDLSAYNGGPFTRCEWRSFNPSSHKQIVDVLEQAHWVPVDKTSTHIAYAREVDHLKYQHKTEDIDKRLQELYTKLDHLAQYGWKINENNLGTLPPDAPAPARTLAKRILLESRRRTLVEWLDCCAEDGRIHGKYHSIGAWTHRMSHQNPNTANIPSEFREDGSVKLLGRALREMWIAPRNRLLVGVDAEGIQLRIFAHYIDDPEFTEALVKGKKHDKSDPHSLNQRILGDVCKSRQAAKRFIYALLLGAGLGKLAEVLGCERMEAQEALDRLIHRYTGFEFLKRSVIPKDAARGYFIGLDGRRVPLPGETNSQRKHLCMSGYLQNGEAIIMKKACLLWHDQLEAEKIPFKFVNFVHDEWQTECKNDIDIAKKIAKTQADSLRIVGEELKLKCPLAGSYWNDDHKDYTIGTNWYQTH